MHLFLNLGACKEYLIMARGKSGKNNSEAKETVSSNNPVTPSESKVQSAEMTATDVKKTRAIAARRPEVVKTEPRANLVPINFEDEIRRAAYLLAEQRGFEPGHETEDWLAAEREVRQRYQRQSA